jgi:hypothetical protein
MRSETDVLGVMFWFLITMMSIDRNDQGSKVFFWWGYFTRKYDSLFLLFWVAGGPVV